MKKLITLLLVLIFSFNSFADCRPMIETDLAKKVISQKRVATAGKITTGAAFVTVGGFYGTMGVVLLGPLWAGAIIGTTFGGMVAAPIGTTFLIVNYFKKKQILNRARILSIIGGGEELNLLHQRLLAAYPELTMEELSAEIDRLNSSEALCDGTVSGKRRLIATPKELQRYLRENLGTVGPTIPIIF